jgi:signal peptidase I
MQTLSSISSMVRAGLRWAVLPLLFFLFIRGLVLEAFTIPTSSMEGTLLVGDFLLVNKALFGPRIPGTEVRLPAVREPERWDVVVFSPPHDRGRSYVKRVVGVPGDTLAMEGKTLFLNGVPQRERYARYRDGRGDAIHPGMRWQSDFLAAAANHRPYAPSRDNWGPLVVPPSKYFVLGDNRDNSEDSRYWGFVGREDITGRPWLVYLSFEADGGERTGWLDRVRWDRVGSGIR